MTTNREVLEAARGLISQPESWMKGKLSNNDLTCFCALGAAIQALPEGPARKHEAVFDTLDGIAVERMASLSEDKFKNTRCLTAYNDLETTTHADILSLFDEAITRSEP